jgi:deazaflavin-dependent oxidoreductase (nitroreductase family)
MKHQVLHALQKYVLNPPIKLLFAIGIVPPGYALLETTGRTTGKPRRTPVGNARIGDRLRIVAEHAMKDVLNLVRHPRVRVKLREGFRARWHTGTAHVLSDDNPRARQRWLAGQVTGSSANAAAVRLFGTELFTCGLIWMGKAGSGIY